MSKLGCECGGTISDTTDQLPYMGAIIRDQDKEGLYDSMASDLNAFMDANIEGKAPRMDPQLLLTWLPSR